MRCARRPEPYDLADHRGIALERRGPEAVGQHDGAGGIGAVVPHVDQAAEHRTQAHHLEVVPPTTPARTSRGSPRPIRVKPMVEKSPNALKDLTR